MESWRAREEEKEREREGKEREKEKERVERRSNERSRKPVHARARSFPPSPMLAETSIKRRTGAFKALNEKTDAQRTRKEK